MRPAGGRALPLRRMDWEEQPDWLRTSRAQRLWVRVRVFLDQSLGIAPPTYVAHNGGPIGPRRLAQRIKGRP